MVSLGLWVSAFAWKALHFPRLYGVSKSLPSKVFFWLSGSSFALVFHHLLLSLRVLKPFLFVLPFRFEIGMIMYSHIILGAFFALTNSAATHLPMFVEGFDG